MEDLGQFSLSQRMRKASASRRSSRITGKRGHRRGRIIRSETVEPRETEWELDLSATLRAAALRGKPLRLTPEAYRKAIRISKQIFFVVFVVDGSESMSSKLPIVRRAAYLLLDSAYRARHVVSLIVFRDRSATVLLHPSTSPTLAARKLRTLRAGGATPVAAGIRKATELIRLERLRRPEISPIIVLLSDGEANVATRSGISPREELLETASEISHHESALIVLEIRAQTAPPSRPFDPPNTSSTPSDLLKKYADAAGGIYYRTSDLGDGQIVAAIDALEDSL